MLQIWLLHVGFHELNSVDFTLLYYLIYGVFGYSILSGVGLRQLIDTVEGAGFSLVAAPYWEGVTVAGLISTGAHGSSWWGKGGAVHDHVLGISIVVPASKSEGYAKILRLEAHNPLLDAAKVSLGVLGAISKVSILFF